MSNIITLACLLLTVSVPALMNIFVYPVSKKLSYKISDGIVRICAPLVFSILSVYKNFKFKGDKNLKEELPQQFLCLHSLPLYLKYPL